MHTHEARLLLVECFKTISNLITGHPTNAATLHDHKGLDVCKEWIQKIAILPAGSESKLCMESLLSLMIIVFNRVHDKTMGHPHALIAIDLIMNETLQLEQIVKYQLLVFAAKILKGSIQKLENTSVESLSKFANQDM
jgi:hypothetical protein